MSDSLWPHGLQPARLLCLWDFPGKNTGAGCHFLLQGIFLTQRSNPRLLQWQADSLPLSYLGSRRCCRFCLLTQGLCPPPALDLLAADSVAFSVEPCFSPPLRSTLSLGWWVTCGSVDHIPSHRAWSTLGTLFFYIDFSLLDWAPEKQKPWLIHLCLSSEALFHTLVTWWPWHIASSLWSSVSSSVKVGGAGSTFVGWLKGLSNKLFMKHSTWIPSKDLMHFRS